MANPYTSAHTGVEIDDAVNRGKGLTPGTALANKALVLGASKNIDTIDIAQDGLEIDGTPITVEPGELNALDGLTANVGELNILDGVTADKDEINLLDGATVTTAEINKGDRSQSDGIAEASKNLVLDANKDLLGKRYDINQSVLGLIASGPFMRFEDGLSSRMNAGDANDLNFADGDFSIVICMLMDGTQALGIGKGAITSADQGYEVRFQTDGDIEVFASDGSSYFINTSASPLGQYVAGEVFILVLSFDKSGNLTQYYNGISQGTLDISAHDEKSVSNSSNFYVDRIMTGGHSQYFLRFYNRALTLAEVRALTSGIPVTYVDSGASMTTLITNGSMEADANWANYGTPTTQERSVTQKHSGTYSRKFTVNAANEGIQGDAFTTVTGKKYRHIVWVYPSGTVVNIGVQKGNNSGWLSNVQYTGLNSGAWNRIIVELAESAGGAGAFIVVHSGAASSGTWYVDDIWGGAIGCTVEYGPNGLHHLQWQDSINNNRGAISSVSPQNIPTNYVSHYRVDSITDDLTITDLVPAGFEISSIIFEETAGNTITSLQIGTSGGGDEIVNTLTISASTLGRVPDVRYASTGMILSKTTHTTVYITDTGGGWNSASINLRFIFGRVF